MPLLQRYRLELSLVLLGCVVLLPGLGAANLFDWDEINFAEIAREMVVSGNYLQPQMRFLPFWEKPPLFFWLQAGAMHVAGINELAARLPNAICGIITLPLLYRIGSRLYDTSFGWLWALMYLGSLLPGLYFQSGIIDPVFNLFIFLSFWFFINYVWKRDVSMDFQLRRHPLWYLLLAGFFAGCAVLTKGPAALVILCLAFFVYWVWKRFRMYISVPHFLFFLAVTASVSGVWYGLETLLHGPWFMEQFITYNIRLLSTEDAGHGGFPGYHLVVVLLGCFPASVFFIKGWWHRQFDKRYQADLFRWMLLLFWTVLILFSLVQSKIIHYSSMTYYPLTYVAALVVWSMHKHRQSTPGIIVWSVRVLAILLGLAMIALPVIGRNPEWIRDDMADVFAKANLLADAGWTGLEVLVGIALIAVTWWGTAALRKGQALQGATILLLGCALVFKTAMVTMVPKVEAYTQRAAIDFFREKSQEDAYIAAIGYKTYADAYYGALQPDNKPRLEDYSDKEQKSNWESWLMHGDIDKIAYFVTRIDRTTELEELEDVSLLYSNNGFLFYQRLPKNK